MMSAASLPSFTIAAVARRAWSRSGWSRFSHPGRYAVAVTRDQGGNDLLARASAAATGNRDREEVSVYLDLRKSKPGFYFLSTTHEQDQASYYYGLLRAANVPEVIAWPQ